MHPKPIWETRSVLCPRVICCTVSLLLSNTLFGALFFRTCQKRHCCMHTLCMPCLVIRNLGSDRCQMLVDLALRILHAPAMLLQQIKTRGDGSLTLSHEVGVAYHVAHGHASSAQPFDKFDQIHILLIVRAISAGMISPWLNQPDALVVAQRMGTQSSNDNHLLNGKSLLHCSPSISVIKQS